MKIWQNINACTPLKIGTRFYREIWIRSYLVEQERCDCQCPKSELVCKVYLCSY